MNSVIEGQQTYIDNLTNSEASLYLSNRYMRMTNITFPGIVTRTMMQCGFRNFEAEKRIDEANDRLNELECMKNTSYLLDKQRKI